MTNLDKRETLALIRYHADYIRNQYEPEVLHEHAERLLDLVKSLSSEAVPEPPPIGSIFMDVLNAHLKASDGHADLAHGQ